MPKPSEPKEATWIGRTMFPGGRTIEVAAHHQEWLDYGVEAVNQHEALRAVAEAARELVNGTAKEMLNEWVDLKRALAELDKVKS